jgi:hypothetical protein
MIMTVGSDGTDLREIVRFDQFGQGANLTEPTWTRDGVGITFVVVSPNTDWNGIWTIRPHQDWVQNVQGSIYSSPSWSPVGNRMAFKCSLRPDGLDVCVLDLNSGLFRQILQYPNLSAHLPRWTPDGHKIVFAGGYIPEGRQVSRGDIFVVNADGTGLTQLTDSGPDTCPDSPYAGFAIQFNHPVPSPDGRSILVHKLRAVHPDTTCLTEGTLVEYGLYILSSSGGNGTLLAEGGFVYADWQPLPPDLMIHIDDGHGHPLEGLKVELKQIIPRAPTVSSGGMYAFENVAPGDYVRITCSG